MANAEGQQYNLLKILGYYSCLIVWWFAGKRLVIKYLIDIFGKKKNDCLHVQLWNSNYPPLFSSFSYLQVLQFFKYPTMALEDSNWKKMNHMSKYRTFHPGFCSEQPLLLTKSISPTFSPFSSANHTNISLNGLILQVEGAYLSDGKSLSNWDVFCHSVG